MKRFQYRLETVLQYKNQILDDLKAEHSVILQKVNTKQEEIRQLNRELAGFESDFDQTKAAGAHIEAFLLQDMCISRMGQIIEDEEEKLEKLKYSEEQKKKEVVAAKVDTSKYDKLKGKRLKEYNRAAMKAEEAFIEEFVSRRLTTERKQQSR